MHVPLYLAGQLKADFGQLKGLLEILRYLPLISLLIIGLTFDTYKRTNNLKIYFIPIILGFLIMLINTPTAFTIGFSILLFTGPFIKINVILKIFDYLKSVSKNDDRSYILKFLIINIFSALAPIVVGSLRPDFSLGLILPVLNLTIWLVFGLIYFFLPCQDNLPPTEIKGGDTFKTLLFSLIGVIILIFFTSYLWSSLYVDNQDYTFELRQGTIQMSVFFLFGLILLFIPNLKSNQKLNFSAIIILILGLMSISVGFINIGSFQSSLLDITIGIRALFDIVFYPALILIFLETFNFNYRAALISLFYFIEFFIPNISGLLRLINQDNLISIMLTVLIIGFLTVRYVPGITAVHNKGYSK
jgi:hypothetical protein